MSMMKVGLVVSQRARRLSDNLKQFDAYPIRPTPLVIGEDLSKQQNGKKASGFTLGNEQSSPLRGRLVRRLLIDTCQDSEFS